MKNKSKIEELEEKNKKLKDINEDLWQYRYYYYGIIKKIDDNIEEGVTDLEYLSRENKELKKELKYLKGEFALAKNLLREAKTELDKNSTIDDAELYNIDGTQTNIPPLHRKVILETLKIDNYTQVSEKNTFVKIDINRYLSVEVEVNKSKDNSLYIQILKYIKKG